MSNPAAIAVQIIEVSNDPRHKGFIRIIAHIPEEAGNIVRAAIPWATPTNPVPAALAVLDKNAGERHGMDPSPATGGEEATLGRGEALPTRPTLRSLSQQAGACCSDPRFQKWIGAVDRDEAANIVRSRCGVSSRSEIIQDTSAGELWNRMYYRFRLWRDVPELAVS